MGNSNGKPVVFTDQVKLDHFRLLRVVGKGAFGKVRIVERRDTGLTFALKYIRKDEVVKSESVRNIIRERRMLEQLNHPFLCNLRYSFQDIEYLYIVVDLMSGGDLRFHISRKTFTEEAVRFWIAELGCALRYIHQQGIVHRDVKPDNVLLDLDGHVHLADFNVASEFTPSKQLTSKSGTLAYLAPEVYEGRGYSSEVDWWSLGVLFYECIYNKRPFEANSHEALSRKIMKADPSYPVTSPPVSMPCLHAISSLLEKDIHQRIGASGFTTFSDNPFFRPIDFVKLERKEIEPVFVPSADKTNFDATYDLEELLLEEAPLEARARRQKPREQLKVDATQQEIRREELHRMIETLFEPFNYTTVSEKRLSGPGDGTRSSVARSQQSVGPHSTSDSEDLLGVDSCAANQSPRGSPPLPPLDLDALSKNAAAQTQGYQVPKNAATPVPGAGVIGPSADRPISYSRPLIRAQGSTRNTSAAGGTQVVLNGTGSWSEMANQSSSLLKPEEKASRPSGVLGFLKSKKGREKSPKPNQQRGVLGKEGARVIVGS